MIRMTTLSAILVVAVACSSGAPQQPAQAEPVQPPPATTIADADIGLAPGTAFEQPAQEPIVANSSDPGDSEIQPRPNADFPPVVPHSVAGLLPITVDENLCLDCHGADNAPDAEAPAAPASHYVDLRNAPDTTADTLAGARHNCVACHVAQTQSAPLVANPAVS